MQMAERKMQLHTKPTIPNDIIVEILLRLPVNSLLQLRWACKYWFDLITRDHDFIKMHHHRSNPLVLISSYKVLYSRKYIDMFDTLTSSSLVKAPSAFMVCINHPFGYHFEILGSCNGLIYLCNRKVRLAKSNDEYFLWNPSTTEFKRLPPFDRQKNYRKYCSTFHGFGYDHTIDDYKVIEIDHGYDNKVSSVTSIIGIYTLGSNSWSTKIETTNPVLKARRICIRRGTREITSGPKSGVLVNGALHWIVRLRSGSTSILCFDVVKEEHRVIQLPVLTGQEIQLSPFISFSSTKLEVLNGCICIFQVNFFYENAELWMMTDYGVNTSWTKLFTINMESLVKEISQGKNWSFSDLKLLKYSHCEDGRILMLCDLIYLITYYPKNDEATIEKTSMDSGSIVEKSYIESLVSVKSGMYMNAAESTTTKCVQIQEDEVNSKSWDWKIWNILSRI